METTSIKMICPKHGEYDALSRNILGLDSVSPCPMCMAEEEEEDKKQEEVKAVDNKSKYFRSCGIPKRYFTKTFSNYTIDGHNSRAFRWCKAYADRFESVFEKGVSLIIYGHYGTGKKHLAVSILKALPARFRKLFTTARKMTADIKSSYGKASEYEAAVVERYVNYDLLIIDEVGRQSASENEKQIMFDVLNGRYDEMKPTIIILKGHIDDAVEFLGPDVVDRFYEHGGDVVYIGGESKRKAAES